MSYINSVLGPIDSADLGFTLMHEHVLVAASGLSKSYPDLLGPDREARAIATLKRAKAQGIDTLLDATTFDLGRDPELLQTVGYAVVAGRPKFLPSGRSSSETARKQRG